MRQSLKLNDIRSTLALAGDPIITNLLRRSRLALNKDIYLPDSQKLAVPGILESEKGGFMKFLLRGRERVDASAGRYDDPREHPFFDDVLFVPRHVPRKVEKQDIVPVSISKNKEIMQMYLQGIESICTGDDGEYGSAATIDIAILQDLSYRVLLGKFVAESKFLDLDNPNRSTQAKFVEFMDKSDWKAVRDLLTDKGQEAKVIKSVIEKGERYGMDAKLIDFVVDFYVNKIIPLTIDVEVEYLQKRRTIIGNDIEIPEDISVKVAEAEVETSGAPVGFGQTGRARAKGAAGLGFGNGFGRS